MHIITCYTRSTWIAHKTMFEAEIRHGLHDCTPAVYAIKNESKASYLIITQYCSININTWNQIVG